MDEEDWDFGSILAGEELLLNLKPAGIKSGHFNLPKYLKGKKFRNGSVSYTSFSKLSGFAAFKCYTKVQIVTRLAFKT